MQCSKLSSFKVCITKDDLKIESIIPGPNSTNDLNLCSNYLVISNDQIFKIVDLGDQLEMYI